MGDLLLEIRLLRLAGRDGQHLCVNLLVKLMLYVLDLICHGLLEEGILDFLG